MIEIIVSFYFRKVCLRQENNEEECRIERREEPGGENSENYELLKLSGDSGRVLPIIG